MLSQFYRTYYIYQLYSHIEKTVYTTMKHMSELPYDNFLQVHRSYIVNIDHIQSIEGNLLNIGSHKIPVAHNLRESTFNIILNNRLIPRE
ncbi:LytTR family transcriptional regulator [Dysgonomonas sp. OttesenSCG-928-D17]|nr:LytTR family transcriptional regulator [Dysgonomonas sp. OttesenSCG-928-D17]